MIVDWSVDIDFNTTEGIVVSISGGALYLDCWVENTACILNAIKYLRNGGGAESFLLGHFVNGSRVELTSFGENKMMYLAVLEPEFCSMSYALQASETAALATALEAACK